MRADFILSSPETATDYRIFVHDDPGREVRAPRPAVLFMDGDDQFAPAVVAYDQLRAAQVIEPLLLVGVGYGASYTQRGNRRGRDYTPVPHGDEPTSGGADAFLRFLTHTLWTELGRRHALDARLRGIAGHSLGSLLVLHALFQPRPFFTHHLASAPSVWWADRAILEQAAQLRSRQSTLPGRVVLSVGEEDTESMTGDLRLLEQQLADQPFTELEVISQRFAARNHYNVLPDAFAAGLTALFRAQASPPSSAASGPRSS
ncbi:alpha/beta hydrolase [Opitutus terrae]|uniref:Putative esterase n=1 Tax=Opitutus terrae (strain DSM 11246 / JCM 15787 / PB90-1) TaxID=452637 RepID=B1ZQU8_OPITP|nr:alpha/beta hydrolase-fold protein [Opitutus terrae]ACB77846.1 putative esterase [Opitutus terrae PB90-1]